MEILMTFYMTCPNDGKGEDDLDKKGHVLDTDIFIAFLRGKNAALKQNVEDVIQQDIPVCMSIMSLGEYP
jgi:hypothetical protein